MLLVYFNFDFFIQIGMWWLTGCVDTACAGFQKQVKVIERLTDKVHHDSVRDEIEISAERLHRVQVKAVELLVNVRDLVLIQQRFKLGHVLVVKTVLAIGTAWGPQQIPARRRGEQMVEVRRRRQERIASRRGRVRGRHHLAEAFVDSTHRCLAVRRRRRRPQIDLVLLDLVVVCGWVAWHLLLVEIAAVVRRGGFATERRLSKEVAQSFLLNAVGANELRETEVVIVSKVMSLSMAVGVVAVGDAA